MNNEREEHIRLQARLACLADQEEGVAPRLCPYPYGEEWRVWTEAYAMARSKQDKKEP